MSELIDQKKLNDILLIFKNHIDDERNEKHGGFYLWEYIEQNKINERHLLYLIEEGLCKVMYNESMEGYYHFAAPMELTNKGIDYLSKLSKF